MGPGSWLVKLSRGAWSTVLSSHGSKSDAEAAAAHFNTIYQTDEYYIEVWDSAKFEGFEGLG